MNIKRAQGATCCCIYKPTELRNQCCEWTFAGACIPVCVRMCPLSSHGLEKALPQVGHTQGRVCERMCIFSAPKLVYSLGQCLQRKAGLAAVTGASLSSSSSGGLT